MGALRHLLCRVWHAAEGAAGEDRPAGSFLPAPAAAEAGQAMAAVPGAVLLLQKFRQLVRSQQVLRPRHALPRSPCVAHPHGILSFNMENINIQLSN